jgi:4-amino-4-deoxy-L-arabinose transferase-like glycosyltransferase
VKTQSLSNRTIYLLLGLAIGIAAAWKIILLNLGAFPFNADEAIVALMARHILHGELPIFFYGQAYMGSLDAFLVAGFFRLFGEQVQTIRYLQIMLYCGVLLTTFWLTTLVFCSKQAALVATIFLAIPTVNVIVYTTVSLGGYGEALLIGNLILCVGLWITSKRENPLPNFTKWICIFVWGLLAGLGFWTNGLTLVYSVPMGIYLLFWILHTRPISKEIPSLIIMLFGIVLGASPWISYAVHFSPHQIIQELFGSAVAVESGSWLSQVAMHTLNFLLFGIPVIVGFRPPWEVTWLVLPLIPFVAVFWFLVIRFGSKWIRTSPIDEKWRQLIPVGVVVLIMLLFIFTHFGVDPSGRYFLPINIVLAVFGGFYIDKGISTRTYKIAGLSLILVFQLLGTIQCVQRIPPGLTTQFDTTTVIDHSYDGKLITFLKETNDTKGYTNYWVSYPLAFLSREELIFSPRLPYHQDLRYTSRDDRYAAYDQIVRSSERIALITTKNDPLYSYLRGLLTSKKISWKEKQIGDYLVFYNLTERIEEADLDFSHQP